MTTEASNVLTALSQDLSGAIAQASESLVAINGRRRMSSSGVHWQTGIIVTAEHTLKRDEEIAVTWADGTTANASLIGRDGGTDLAVLRVETHQPIAQTADLETLQVGNLVLAIARSPESGVNASMGVISALGGSWRSWHGGQIDRFIRPDLTLYPGFSGGALIDTQSRVIGINTAGPRHWTLTIPAPTVQRVVDQLVNRGRIARGYLGLGMQLVQLPESLKSSLQLTGGGVIVVSVEANGPSDRAGVLIGDVIVSLADQPVSDIRDVHALLDPDRVGQALTAQIIRAGALMQLTITVGERP